jgi:uroporphyrinogen decarboxylase
MVIEEKTMKRKERFSAAMKIKPVDRVPMFDFLFQKPLYEELIGHRPDGYNAKDAISCALALDHDAVWIPFGAPEGHQNKYLNDDTYIDEWGTTYKQNFASWPIDAPVDYPIKTRSDFSSYHPPDPTLPGRTGELETAQKVFNDDIALMASTTGPFTIAWLLMGYENISYALYDDPDLLTAIFQIAVDFGKEAARRSVEDGCDGFIIADDLGDSTREFLKKDHFDKFLLPYIADLADYADSLGVPVLLHCCGHFKNYLDGLAQTRIAAIHPFQRTAGMDLSWAKENYGKRFCIVGNIDSSRTLPFGLPSDIETEVKEAIDIAAPGWGYVLASDHSLHDGIPVENVVTMFKVGAEYGKAFYRKKDQA